MIGGQVELALDNKTVKFTGWSAVLLMLFGNIARFLTTMDINDLLLITSSIVGLVYLVFKTITAYYVVKEKIEEAQKRKREIKKT